MDFDDSDSIDSILTEIETSLSATYPATGEAENQVYSAYHEDLRTVGYGRREPENWLTYNNPFDPRITFNGLGEYIHHPDIKDEKHKAEMTQNVFLALDQPSQLMDKYLNGYRSYVRGLSGSPGSGDWMDSTTECRRLYERISSESVKSIWAEIPKTTAESKAVKTVPLKQTDSNPNVRIKTTKARHTMRQKAADEDLPNDQMRAVNTTKEGCNTDNSKDVFQTDKSKDVFQTDNNRDVFQGKPKDSLGKKKSLQLKSNANDENLPVQENKELWLADSWAGLFKKKNKETHQISGVNSGDEDISRSDSVKCGSEIKAGNKNCGEPKQVQTFGDDGSQLHAKNYVVPNAIYTKVTTPLPPNQRNEVHQGMKYPAHGIDNGNHQRNWSQQVFRPEPYNNPTGPMWNDKCNNQQVPQANQWAQHGTYQHPSNYQSQQVYIPPPPGFNQVPSQNRSSVMNNQRSNYQSNLQQNGMYHNSQQEFANQQSVLYNLQRYIQPPADQIQNTTNRYHYYGHQKPQFMYQGNWNANNNTEFNDEEMFSDESCNTIHYSQHPKETTAEDITTSKEYREKPKCKSRQIRANLIRIFPSKDNR